ncbi:2-hydroxychromene-2-carboxylate isomerase [Marinicauda salina]|nr:DsbA family protein [Marinicauda salina]
MPVCFFGFRSPYSRLGLHKLARAGVECDLHPFTGPPEGVAFLNPTDSPPKLKYYAHDAPRMTALMRLPMVLPDPFETDYKPANRAFYLAKAEGQAMDFALAVSDARWGEGRDIADPDVLRDCADACGLSGLIDRVEAESDRIADAAAETRALVEKHDVFGVPFLIDGAEPYWGHDRFDLFLERRGKS